DGISRFKRTECKSRPSIKACQHQARHRKSIPTPRNDEGTLDIDLGSRLLPDIRDHDLDDPNPKLPREGRLATRSQGS
ncbi:hypothetical protein PIB30_104506, partial [Stylosanthes scabra]|nr:hypothetical protein [Stylosanthes scabra]